MTTAACRIAVIGGGISGLAATHRLSELRAASQVPLDITLFEASDRWGGIFGTEQVDGYTLERGADMFITDKPWGLDLVSRLGLTDRLIAPDPRYRRSLILSRGRPTPTPDAFNLMVPGRWWPVATTPILSPLGKLRLLLEPCIPRRRDAGPESDESLASFVRRRLGREALDRLVQPLVGGIYTADPEKLSLEATLPRFRRMESEHGSLAAALWAQRRAAGREDEARQGISGARYGLFVSLQGGMGELQQALIDRLSATARLRLETPIVAIDRASAVDGAPLADGTTAPRYRLTTAAGESSEFDGVVLALPSYRSADLVERQQPELAARLREIEYASAVIVVSAHRLSDIADPLDAYGLVVPHRERRRILAVSFLTRKFPQRGPEGRAVLRTFIGGDLQPELTRLGDDEILSLVRDELCDILGVRGEPELTRIVRYDRAMPQYHVGHLGRVARIEALTAALPGLELCGNAYRGVGLPDCIHSGETAAERLLATLTSPTAPT